MTRARKRILAVTGAVLVAVAALVVVPALATPPVGTTVTPLAPTGEFGPISARARIGDWSGKIKTKGNSDLYMTEVTIQPGGTLGLHSHPGLSFVIVNAGTAAFYDGDGPACTPHTVQDRK